MTEYGEFHRDESIDIKIQIEKKHKEKKNKFDSSKCNIFNAD